MSEHDEKPDQIVKAPDQIVGRTPADLFFHTQTGPKLDAALSRVVDWPGDLYRWGKERVLKLFGRVNQMLEEGDVETKAIPERVAIEVIENVAREDREELLDWWARLFVSSARGDAVDAYHIDVVRKLDPCSARVLLVLGYQLESLPTAEVNFEQPIKRFLEAVGEKSHVKPVEAQLACHRLVAIGIAEWDIYGLRGYPVMKLTGFGQHLLSLLYPGQPISKVTPPPQPQVINEEEPRNPNPRNLIR